jgi:hypothetical protein
VHGNYWAKITISLRISLSSMAQIEGGQEQSSASRPTGWWRRRADLLSKLRSNMLLVAAAGAAALVGAALVTRVLQQSNRSAKFQPRPPRRTHARYYTMLALFVIAESSSLLVNICHVKDVFVREGGSENPEDSDVSIPLKEVIRFKERQWFLEELDVS